MEVQTEFLLLSVKLIESIFSAVSGCSNAFIRPLTRIKIFFLVLDIWTTPKIITFLPAPPPGCEKKSFSIKFNTISRIFILINISIFS